MKKIIFSLALLTGLTGVAQAQTGLKLGLKGGLNNSTFSGSGNDSENWADKLGFAAGGLLNYGFTDHLSVQAELLYSQKGASLSSVPYGSDPTVRLDGTAVSTLGYLDLPVLVRINAGAEGKGLFMEVGVQGGLLLHQRAATEDPDGKRVASFVITDRGARKTQIGYVAGLGYQLTNGLGLGVRYTVDFSRAYQGSGPTTVTTLGGVTTTAFPGNPNLHNSVAQVQVHYLLGGR